MILHVDMDAFYASVEQRDRPGLRGLPVIVGARPERRGVVAAASYEARRFGVRSAMSSARARRLCPQAVFVAPRMSHYVAESGVLRGIFAAYTPLVEPLSLDEAFLDVAASERLFGPAEAIARRIRADVRERMRLTCSVGVARNKFLAKLASEQHKPDGLTVVPPGGEQAFLDPLPVQRLWGIGEVAASRLQALGIATVGDLRSLPEQTLAAALGAGGRRLHALARAIDDRPVVPDHAARQLSRETTFADDVGDADTLRGWLLALTEELAERLRHADLAAGGVTVKARRADFHTVTRHAALRPASDSTDALWRRAAALLPRAAPRGVKLRLLGIAATDLEPLARRQADLFAADGAGRGVALDGLADAVRGRFGPAALRRAGGLRSRS